MRATDAKSTITDAFVKKFNACRSTQDLEDLLEAATTPEECNYIATRLDNPNTKAVNGHRIQNIINNARNKATTLSTKATLDKAGFTEDIIKQMQRESQGKYSSLVPYTLDMVKYLEARIATGEQITPDMINDAIAACDNVYSQARYGSAFQEQQLELLDKYWKHAPEAREAYHKEGRFFTKKEAKYSQNNL